MATLDHVPFQAGLDALDAGVVLVDTDRKIIFWNVWMETASGLSRDRVLGLTLTTLFPTAKLARLQSSIDDALQTGASSLLSHALHPQLLPLRTRTGVDLIHNTAVRPIADKPYAACLLQIFDVTVATERERLLRQRQNARYDAVVQSAPDPILTLDIDGVIRLANGAAAAEFGFPVQDLLDRPFTSLLCAATEWEVAWHEIWSDAPTRWPIEVVAFRQDGSESYLDASASRWQSGSSAFVTVMLRDVNERRAAEAKLRQLNDTLEERVEERSKALELAHEQLRQSQKVEAIGQLTGGIAHDFNNLLTPILGGLDILQRRGGSDARGQRLIDGALQSAERARVLVQRLLAFARQQPLQPFPVDIAAVVQNMLDLVGSTLGPRVRVVVDVQPDLPRAMADPNQLEMALLNLAVNARDAMPDGGTLTITTGIDDLSGGGGMSPGRYISLSVSDTGVGMDAETLNKAVEPFFSTKGIGKGTGLGLSMIHGLAAQLGGRLDLASTAGVGTTVKIWLPVARMDAVTDLESYPNEDALAVGAGVVLLVDDEDLVRATTSQMLADLGYTVIEASSAREALSHLRDPTIKLLISDHLMPGMSGTELARESQAIRPHMPVLIISGYADLEDVAPDLPRLMKPFREAELSTALMSLQSREPSGRPPAMQVRTPDQR